MGALERSTQQSIAKVSGEFRYYWKTRGRKVNGGAYSAGLRKTRKPFSSKRPMHLVLWASRAIGPLSMWASKSKKYVKDLIY